MAKIPFHGIVAVGNTKTDAIAQYRELAKGKDVSVFVDAGKSLSFVSNSKALAHVFNPMTGEMDMKEAPALAKSLSFASESSSEDREVNYYECKSSCGGHVVYDADQVMNFCPICTATVSMSGDDAADEDLVDGMESESESDDDEDGATDDEGADGDSLDLGVDEDDAGDDEGDSDDDEGEESDSDDEDAEEDDGEGEDVGEDDGAGDDEGEESDSDDEDDEGDAAEDVGDDDSDDSDDEGEESDSDDGEDAGEDEDSGDDAEDEDEDPVVVAASSKQEALQLYMKHRNTVTASETEVEVDYKVCSSAECGAHIISESADTCNCPVCDSKLQEPKAESSTMKPPAKSTSSSKKSKPVKVSKSDDDAGDDAGDDEDVLDVPEDGDDGDDDTAESSATVTTKIAVSGKSAKAKSTAAPVNVSKSDDGEDVEDDPTDDVDADSADDSAECSDLYKDLDVAFSGAINGKPQWTAWYKGKPIAVCTAATAGANADIFQTPEFGRTVILAAKHAGIKPALQELGFKPLVRRVSFSRSLSKMVAQKMDLARAALDKEHNEFKERFQAALATAAVGTTRGFFTGVENPLKTQLHAALSAAGVRNPDVLLNQAFKTSADAYHKMLFAKATEIMGKPAEVQESLARAVLEVNFVESTSASPAESTNSTEIRLASMGTRPNKQEQPAPATRESSTSADQASAASTFTTSLAKVVSSLGRSGRF